MADKVIDWNGATRPELCNEIERLRSENALLDECVKAAANDAQWDRLHFIRDAAIRIYVAGMSIDGRERLTAEGKLSVVCFSPLTSWKAARELWDNKPEDC